MLSYSFFPEPILSDCLWLCRFGKSCSLLPGKLIVCLIIQHYILHSSDFKRNCLVSFLLSANRIRLWNKGVDSESFHPRFRTEEMRLKLR